VWINTTFEPFSIVPFLTKSNKPENALPVYVGSRNNPSLRAAKVMAANVASVGFPYPVPT